MAAGFQKDSCSSWLYLIVVSVVTFFTFGFLDAYGVLMVFLVDHYNESNSKTAWIGSLTFFCVYFLYPFILSLNRKLGTRAILLIAGALVVPTFLLCPLTPTMNLLFITFSIPFGITCSIIECATFTTVLEYFDKYRGVAFGMRIGTGALGTMMYSFLLPVLMTELGWKRTCWILTSMSGVCAFYAWVYRSPELVSNECSVNYDSLSLSSRPLSIASSHMKLSSRKAARKTEKNSLRIYFNHLQNKRLVVFLLAIVAFHSVALMPPIFMVRFATNIGYNISQAKWLMVIRTITSVATRFTAGRLGDLASKCRNVRYIVLFNMTLFSILTLLCSLSTFFPVLLVYMALVSIIDSIHWTIQPLFVAEVTRGVHSDKAFALFNCVGSFAMLGGPPALGWLYDQTGDFNFVFYTTSAVSALGACLVALGLCLSSSHTSSSFYVEHVTDTSVSSSDSQPTIVSYEDDYVKLHQQQQQQYITAV